jgi:hypothetical protein
MHTVVQMANITDQKARQADKNLTINKLKSDIDSKTE